MALILPMNHLGDFIDLSDTIRNYKSDVYLNKATRIADPSRSTYVTVDIKGKSKIIYTVQEGDNLGFISEWYRTSLADLRNWNNINRNSIRIGQKIVIYVDPAKFEYYSRINSMSFEEKQSTVGKIIPSNSVRILARTSEEPEGEFITYTVRNGDTIWDIVKLYENVTTSQVLSLNNLANADKLQVGQRLKIKKKS
jgi:membrane-bound lytic murein transglycosylase D